MKIDMIVLGDLEANCYCLRKSEKQKKCLIIDPGLQPEPLIRFLKANHYEPVSIILTHGHVDHIGGVESLREFWPTVEVAIHKNDANMLRDPALNLSTLAGTMVQARPAEVLLDDNLQYFTAAGLRFQILHTPGHSPGGICLYSAKDQVLFAGDTLFAGSVGRTDFTGGSYETLIESITTKLLTLPERTTVYPGHGPQTSLEAEKRFNPFVNANRGDGTL
ncbi:MAG: MBL fold metallo-hydrolase [Chitinivibrionales bacterium]|nr:MBL fold metallo-hydrolase [Chitinivibrionales bacterium]